jgi:hypothetical protein
MDSFDRSRNMSSTAVAVQPFAFHTTHHFPAEPPRLQSITSEVPSDADKNDSNVSFMKGPKRKRLAKVSLKRTCLDHSVIFSEQ